LRQENIPIYPVIKGNCYQDQALFPEMTRESLYGTLGTDEVKKEKLRRKAPIHEE
jgi:hypothetical protein